MSQKLRASCNACNQAKVKCTKTRPTCARCAKHRDIECVYSVSLRAGKRPAQNNDARFKKLGQPLVDSPGGDARFRPSGIHPDVRGNDARSRSPVQSAMDIADEWALDPSATADLMSMENDMYLTMVGYDRASLDPPSLFDTSSSSPSSSLCQNPSNTSSFDSLRDTWYQHLPDAFNASPFIFQPRQPSSLFSSTPSCPTSPLQSPSTPALSSVCCCFKTVLQTLTNLQAFSSIPCPTFDVALAHNKEAVTLCSAALRCVCPGDTTFVFLIVSLIDKILSVYQSSCNAWSQSTPASSTSPASVPTIARVTLGVYSLDQEDEERIKMEFLRMELRKVEALVSKLKEKASKGHVDYEVKMHEALIQFLEGRLRAAFDCLLIK
ncbi:hypothetical protein MMC30_001305 [Trapelia coarctata]|nr:hypothetical protein [Trapelia coarctata]